MRQLPWWLLLLLCATLGLAPFTPPHIWEKLQMISAGLPLAFIDVVDLFVHGIPWLLVVARAVADLLYWRDKRRARGGAGGE